MDPGTGLVTAMANGTATITATAGGAQASIQLVVAQAITGAAITPDTVTLTALGAVTALTARAKDANGRTVAGVTFTWSSSNQAVVQMSASGVATAITNGETTITARSGTLSATARVTVAQTTSRVFVNPSSIQLGSPGAVTQFLARALDARNNPVPGARISWSSSDPAVATAGDSGTVTAMSAGTAVITGSCGQVSGTGTLQVGFQCYANLPQPQLVLRNTEDRNGFRYYNLSVTNPSEFPAELFGSSPDLPAFGLNPYASRTWVDIHADGRRVYGFCGLSSPDQLDGIWFAIQDGAARPSRVYITLTDRRCGRVYQSTQLTL